MVRTAVMFSGGKDSMYALAKAKSKGKADLLISIKSSRGDTQLHAGPEVSEKLRKKQLDLIGLPFIELEVNSEANYLHNLFVGLKKIVKDERISTLVTGDLWHPYTSGIGDMLAGALGVSLWRPAREACPSIEKSMAYMRQVASRGIDSIIVSVRKGDLPKNLVGKTLNLELLRYISRYCGDAAGEGGQYQSFVTGCPLMSKRIEFDKFPVKEVRGKNGKELFYRMETSEFHIF